MHGQDYAGQDIAGWFATEKLDGCRAWWDGAALWSRSGRPIKAPPDLLAELPAGIALDGELYAGPGTREAVAAAMRNGRWPDGARFVVFDAPDQPGDLAQRLAAAAPRFARLRRVKIIAPQIVATRIDAADLLHTVTRAGGEGLMLHAPGTPYTPGRVSHLLKLKEWLL